MKYYNNCLFHNIQKDFLVQTGDPTGSGKGGQSIYGYSSSIPILLHFILMRRLLYGDQANYFKTEISPGLKHDDVGVVAMANRGTPFR